MMEDSGFDSGDRVAHFMNYTNNLESENSSNEDILNINRDRMPSTSSASKVDDNIDDLLYRDPSLITGTTIQTSTVTADGIITPKKSHHLNEHNKKLSNINSCQILQRKLELKVQRAKRNFLQNEKFNRLENEIEIKKSSTTLIPINRLPFPRNEVLPLVDYKSDNSDDDDEAASFFPVHKKPKKFRKNSKQQFQQKASHKDVDTFSIQEMTIIESDSDGNDGDKSSDADDCDSQLNLELPTRAGDSFIGKVRQLFCCTRNAQNLF